MAELKPCPFCGSKISGIFDWLGNYFVACKKCDARTSSYLTAGQAISAWNKRSK